MALYAKLSGIVGPALQLDIVGAGPRLKNNAGTVDVRNAADNAYVPLHCDALTANIGTSAVSDSATNTLVYPWIAQHVTSGTPAANIGSGIKYQVQNSTGTQVDAASQGGILTTVTSGSEVGAWVAYSRTGGALVEGMRLHGSGAVSVGNTTDGTHLGDLIFGDGSATGRTLSARTNSVTVPVISMSVGASTMTLGTTTTYSTTIQTATKLIVTVTSTRLMDLSAGLLILFKADGAGPSTTGTIRPSDVTGTDQAGAVLTVRGSLGTGSGAISYLSLGGSINTTTGTTAHTAGESARAYGQYLRMTGGMVNDPTAVKTTTYTTLITDSYVPVDTNSAAFTVTLVTAPPNGFIQEIKDQTGHCLTNNLTIARGGSDTIENGTNTTATSISIATNFGVARLRYNAGVWYRIGTL